MDSARDAWRPALLAKLGFWATAFGAIIVVSAVIHAASSPHISIASPEFMAVPVGYLSMVASRFLPRLGYLARTLALLGGFLVAATGAALYGGLAAGAVMLLGLCVLAAGLFWGRAGLIAMLAVTAGIVGVLGGPIPVEKYSAVMTVIAYAGVTGALSMLVLWVLQRLESALAETSDALSQLRAEQSLRERTQINLSRTQATLYRAQKLDAVGRLAGGVAHDFNNTLQVVLGWTELLQRESTTRAVREGLTCIRDAATQSRHLTRQLLAFSRPELQAARQLELEELVPSLVKSYRRLMPDDVRIESDVDPGLRVFMDAGHLSQVLLNLTLNARDAMPQGGVLRFRARACRPDELPEFVRDRLQTGGVEISVSDTGSGMDQATRERAFEPFFSTKGRRGTGLGLATVHGVVNEAKGVVLVESALGKGSTFRIYLPASREDPAGPLEALERVSAALDTQTTILLAEDNPGVRQSLGRALTAGGHRVHEAEDVPSARDLVSRLGAQIDVLVTDGVMPGGSARDLIDDFLAVRPNGRVILCSGYVEDELSRRRLASAPFEFLAKPFEPSVLLERIDGGAGSPWRPDSTQAATRGATHDP